MSEGFPASIEKKPSPSETFMASVGAQVDALQASGRLSEEQAREKKESAELVEVGFSKDPAHDGRMFAMAGVVSEEEFISELERKNGESTSSESLDGSALESTESHTANINQVAEIIDSVIQQYAAILRIRWMENHALDDANPIKEPTAQSLFAAIKSLNKAQENFDEAFTRMGTSGTSIDNATVQQMIRISKEIGKRFETLQS